MLLYKQTDDATQRWVLGTDAAGKSQLILTAESTVSTANKWYNGDAQAFTFFILCCSVQKEQPKNQRYLHTKTCYGSALFQLPQRVIRLQKKNKAIATWLLNYLNYQICLAAGCMMYSAPAAVRVVTRSNHI